MKIKDLIEKYGDREIKEDFDIEQHLKPVAKTYFPKVGEKYFYIDNCMLVCSKNWIGECRDFMCYEIGNCFRTNKEALNKIEELKILQKMKELDGREEYIINKDNWHLNYYYNEIGCGKQIAVTYAVKMYFDTEEDCRNAIKEIGKERLLKYYFKMEESK